VCRRSVNTRAAAYCDAPVYVPGMFNCVTMFLRNAFTPFSRRCFHSSYPRPTLFWRSQKASVPALYKVRKEPWLTPTMILVGIMPIFTFALGTWQLQRLKWKVNLIDELEEKLELPPLSLPSQIKFRVFFFG